MFWIAQCTKHTENIWTTDIHTSLAYTLNKARCSKQNYTFVSLQPHQFRAVHNKNKYALSRSCTGGPNDFVCCRFTLQFTSIRFVVYFSYNAVPVIVVTIYLLLFFSHSMHRYRSHSKRTPFPSHLHFHRMLK